jgi:hypothetical protein
MPALIKSKTGKISLLRVHDVGTKYGPSHDQLDAEVIVRFQNDGHLAYGFKLRNDNNLPVAQAMFAMLQDAFNTRTSITIEYREEELRNNHSLFRVIQNS